MRCELDAGKLAAMTNNMADLTADLAISLSRVSAVSHALRRSFSASVDADFFYRSRCLSAARTCRLQAPVR